MKKTLYDMAMDSELHIRFVAREETEGHKLTDEEIYNEAKYQLEDLPYKPMVETEPDIARKAMRQMRTIIKKYEGIGGQ